MLNNVIALLNGGGAGGGGSSFESIATATGTGSSGTITFSSIPSTYKHLQIRGNFMTSNSGQILYVRCNGDSGTNYAWHLLGGDGTNVYANNGTSATYMNGYGNNVGTANASYMTTAIVDIHDYASTTKNKTMRSFSGLDKNGSGEVNLTSGLWINTNAVTSVTLTFLSGNWTTSTTFALYGIKGS